MKRYPYRVKPFDYQREGMRLIYKQETVGLFWEMGCGKTKCFLDFVGVMLYNKLISQALVICKLRGIAVWEDEIKQNMLPDVNYAIIRPGPMPLGWERSKILIINYDYARRIVSDLLKLAPDVVGVDEGHRIKNHNARQSKMCHKFAQVSRYRVDMTGTPIGNKPLDLWSQFRFIKPDLLEEKFNDFKTKYALYRGFGGFEIHRYRDLKGLGKIIAPYVSIQKSTTGVISRFIEVPVDMPTSAKKLYKQMEEEFVAYVTEETVISAPIVLAKLTKLSQISGGFIRDTENEIDHPVHTAKLEALKEYTDSLKEQGEKRIIVFARFLWELEQIKQLLANDWVTYTVKGGVSLEEQKQAEILFKESGGAMIRQTSSGSESANLQSCQYEFFYSYNYSFIDFYQALKRIDRHGQLKDTCFYYIFLCRGTLDRRIYNILRQKKNVADEVRNLVEDIKKGKLA